MKEKVKKNFFISFQVANEVLRRRLFNVPRKFYPIIFLEMEELGMIKKIGIKKYVRYEFIGKDIDKILNNLF